jgi:sulfite reductase alpha subunit-like flavoprotein
VQDVGSSFDETLEPFVSLANDLPKNTFFLMFVSTTGDGEHCDSIRDTWRALLQKSLPPFQGGQQFAMFCLGDRAYGPQFCAGGRKLAVRLLRLGMARYCDVGYGDDNTPNGGVFRDLDDWLEQHLLPTLETKEMQSTDLLLPAATNPFRVRIGEKLVDKPNKEAEEWQDPRFQDAFRGYFTQACPVTAYSYDSQGQRKENETGKRKYLPLLGEVLSNERITSQDWEQDTRHIRIQLQSTTTADDVETSAPLPYQAGDIATVLPFNSDAEVDRFLAVLPESIRALADCPLSIDVDESAMDNSFTRWPRNCTFRGWLKYCAGIHSLPEREDLRALSPYCSDEHEVGKDQSEKLRSLSETSEAALYADYILREKRSWADVLFDFESLSVSTSKLSLEALLVLLPPMRPRDFSIASAPSTHLIEAKDSSVNNNGDGVFSIDLCVAVVEGRTRLGRSYHGLCSEYLSRMTSSSGSHQPLLQVWIRPGTFGKLPLDLTDQKGFEVPILCVGAGTGVAPMRSLIQERDAVRSMALRNTKSLPRLDENDNILVFGCRKEHSDFYYQDEWQRMGDEKGMRILTAFSRDQFQKIYVQKVLREADGGTLIAKHILERNGALYIAGGPKMARAVKEEVVEALGKELQGGEKEASQLLSKLQRIGRFGIEAWS